jgi:LysM repeat protein
MKRDHAYVGRVVAPIAVVVLAAALLFVLTTSLGDSGDGKRGGGQGSGKERTDEKFYVVEPGDSLTTISDKTGISVDKLTLLNPELDPQALISGQRVKLR